MLLTEETFLTAYQDGVNGAFIELLDGPNVGSYGEAVAINFSVVIIDYKGERRKSDYAPFAPYLYLKTKRDIESFKTYIMETKRYTDVDWDTLKILSLKVNFASPINNYKNFALNKEHNIRLDESMKKDTCFLVGNDVGAKDFVGYELAVGDPVIYAGAMGFDSGLGLSTIVNFRKHKGQMLAVMKNGEHAYVHDCMKATKNMYQDVIVKKLRGNNV